MPIQLLEESVIARIAAGEVVERPSSVAKELLENAIDAGADYIQIDVRQGGRKLIRVSDNGSGIVSDEIPLAIARHATSKLRVAEQLYEIQTLGFRGEALSSIVAVSQTTIVTRNLDEQMGIQVRIDGGEILSQKAVGAPAGTIISVENLFYNMPARLKFLKSESTERRVISTLVMNYAMAYPNIKFVYVQDDRETFRTSGSGLLQDVVVKVFGLSHYRQMIEISGSEVLRGYGGKIHVTGFVSEPQLNRKDRSRIILFMNGRAIQDSSLSYSITQAYHNLLAKGRYPLAVVMIEVPPDFVDVNVHPTKAEVRFQDANITFIAVQRIIREAILGHDQATSKPLREPSIPTTKPLWGQSELEQDDTTVVDEFGTIRRTESDEEVQSYNDSSARPRTLPPLRVIGQVGATYIVAEGPAGLYLVDQHNAHARVLYDELDQDMNQYGELASIEVDSQAIDVSASEARLLDTIIDPLKIYGLYIEPFGVNTFIVRQMPQILAHLDHTEMLSHLLELLQGSRIDLHPMILKVYSQFLAIKSGQVLKLPNMQEIIAKLEYCPNPLVGLNEKPTLIHISAEQLAHEFKLGSN